MKMQIHSFYLWQYREEKKRNQNRKRKNTEWVKSCEKVYTENSKTKFQQENRACTHLTLITFKGFKPFHSRLHIIIVITISHTAPNIGRSLKHQEKKTKLTHTECSYSFIMDESHHSAILDTLSLPLCRCISYKFGIYTQIAHAYAFNAPEIHTLQSIFIFYHCRLPLAQNTLLPLCTAHIQYFRFVYTVFGRRHTAHTIRRLFQNFNGEQLGFALLQAKWYTNQFSYPEHCSASLKIYGNGLWFMVFGWFLISSFKYTTTVRRMENGKFSWQLHEKNRYMCAVHLSELKASKLFEYESKFTTHTYKQTKQKNKIQRDSKWPNADTICSWVYTQCTEFNA